MTEKDFVEMLNQYRECLSDIKKFSAFLSDLFPTNTKMNHILINLFKLGLPQDLEESKTAGDLMLYNYKKQMVNSFGTDEKLAETGIRLWMVCYGQEILGCDLKLSAQAPEKEETQNEEEIDGKELIGKRVQHRSTRKIGKIIDATEERIKVSFHGELFQYPYPECFSTVLELEDEDIYIHIKHQGQGASFESFRSLYRNSIQNEIGFIRRTGGKRYMAVDGERISSRNGEYMYAFETDTDMSFPDGTAIKIYLGDSIVTGYVVSCEEYSILFRTLEYLGEKREQIEFSSEQYFLLESLIERLDEIDPKKDRIAYQVACEGKSQIDKMGHLKRGQNTAIKNSMSQPVTFVWGPPGTGKTETLSKIALEYIGQGKRVLMLSYSNVSVDGALLRVARKSDYPEGVIVRYGYPRVPELIDNSALNSYQIVLGRHSELDQKYQDLREKKKHLSKKDPERQNINKELSQIRKALADKEKELINQASFVATTVSKAVVDSAIYSQRFDAVIFDEASMAYVPQIVFSASLAKEAFICLGDFRQLPAIVQNNEEERLREDIFEFAGIEEAVENGIFHNWLVMLDTQYRMHPKIAQFVSREMYGSLLQTDERSIARCQEIAKLLPMKGEPISVMDLSGMYSTCIKTMDQSRINILSAFISLYLATEISRYNEVGIITPYSAQSRLIHTMIRDLKEKNSQYENITCATVHQFQGSEKAVIIYDAVDCYRMPYIATKRCLINMGDRLWLSRYQKRHVLSLFPGSKMRSL